jgi:rhodanese-related sulfurtransferase
MRNITTIVVIALSLLATSSGFAAEGFPGREKYPKVPYYELEQLNSELNDVVVVDARSKLEFETLRIKTAINIPVAGESFEQEVAKLRNETSKPIVFYCNGHTCMKSYISVKKAKAAGIDNTFAFDAGIFDWTKAHPDKAILLGESPVNLAKLIPKKSFKAKLLTPDVFSDRATLPGRKTMVIDVRDKFQRAGIGFYPGKERWASLDQKKKLQKYINKAVKQNRTLLIYDEVGKQVRWLQYELEKAGVKDYYFMDKGARGYYRELATWVK